MTPAWLHLLAVASLSLALFSALAIAIDLLQGHRQHMAIMNVVWPITALWAGPLGLWAYFAYGRAASEESFEQAKERGEEPPSKKQPFPILVAKGATHCGSGCALGDIAAEWLVLAVPIYVFGKKIFGAW